MDAPFRKRVAEVRERLYPYRIGSQGQLLEFMEEFADPEPEHRHFSHLFGLHPGRHITPRTPELFAAVRRSHEMRGDGGTGWSLAWKVNQWARLLDGDHAFLMLGNLLTAGRDVCHELFRGRRRVSEPVRRASALSDRRQLRRDRRDCRDAGAESRRRDSSAAGPALRVACWARQRVARPRRVRDRSRVGGGAADAG